MTANTDGMTTVRRESVRSAMVLLNRQSLVITVCGQHLTHGCSIVPYRNIVFVPLKASMHLLCRRNNLSEVSDDSIAFSLGDPHNLSDEARIEKHTVPASDRVCSDERVFCGNRLAADTSTESMRI